MAQKMQLNHLQPLKIDFHDWNFCVGVAGI